MWGSSDIVFPVSIGETYHKLLPNSKFITFNAEQMPMEELPRETYTEVLKFVKNIF